MTKVEVKLDEAGKGAFYIRENEKQIAEMEVEQKAGELTVYHTEVDPDYEDKGLAKLLLANMVEYARSNHLKVVPLCRFVLIQFKKNKTAYDDIWKH